MKGAFIRLHTAVFLWGFTGVLGRAISLQEGWLVWWRMLIATVGLWLMLYFFKSITKISLKDFLKVSAVGTLLALHWLTFYGSIKYANVSIALTCLSTTGLLSAIIEPLFFRRRINMFEFILGLFALGGIALIYATNLSFSTGIYVGLISAILTVIVSVLNKKLVAGYKPQTLMLYQLTGGFLGLTLLLPFYEIFFPAQQKIPQGYDWLWLLILSFCCTIFTFILYINALRQVSAFTVNLTLTLEPVYGIILAFIFFNEDKTLSKYFFWGFGLILIAVFLQMFALVKQHRKLSANTL
jgi:drug/metabolite transporter (DMT)-like permease